MKTLKLLGLLLSLQLSASGLATADTLDFSGNICSANGNGSGAMTSCSNNSYINQNYGDTALVDVSYDNISGGGTSLRYWFGDYNELQNVLFADGGDANSRARIVLGAADGYVVNLNSFLLGAWPSNVLSTNLIVSNGVDTYTFAGSVGANNLATLFSGFGNAGIGNTVTIEWYNSAYNVGIDNIQFSVTAVPEPQSVALMLAGLGVLGLVRRRKSS